jgi:hypothetical protein
VKYYCEGEVKYYCEGEVEGARLNGMKGKRCGCMIPFAFYTFGGCGKAFGMLFVISRLIIQADHYRLHFQSS